ncbi:hypothetical protein [Paraburkholderia terrae]|uniref:Uncharacterized protein n=1 Tax=Paraburkholderia terrae TaxID=311230 RepID=A0A2I8EPR8_9BURK|nr:hypothetical protein [Paraburkholderia terrae]AUT61566.1 hypothetical protein C2L65_17730 [Paraburkholderia terrae]
MDAQESPDRERGGRQQQYESAYLPDSDDPQARHYSWVQICLISAMGLAVGVMGTAAYVIWFNRDQVAYAEAVESARRPLPTTATSANGDLRIPSHAAAAVPTSSVSGRVIPATPTQKPAPANTDSLAAAQTADDDTDADADANDPSQAARTAPGPNNSAAARADRGKQPGNAARHAQRAKPKETFVSRLTAMFRKVGYNRRTREPGNNPDPYSHP